MTPVFLLRCDSISGVDGRYMNSSQAWSVPSLTWRGWALVLFVLAFSFVVRAVGLGYPSGQYFDEIYYVPAAQNYINHVEDSNTVHPPLGKIEIAAGALLANALDDYSGGRLGLNDHAEMRVASLICGTLLVWFTFLLAYRMSRGNRSLALVAMFFVSLDFLAFVLSRICMLDMMLALWILVGAYCAWRYLEECWNETSLSWQYAVMAALAFGCATACKWSGLFAAFGAFWAMFLFGEPGRWEPLPANEGELGSDSGGDSSEWKWFVPSWWRGDKASAEPATDASKHNPETATDGSKRNSKTAHANLPASSSRLDLARAYIAGSWRRFAALVAIFVCAVAGVYVLAYIPLLSIKHWSVGDTVAAVRSYIELMLGFRYDPKQFTHSYLSKFWTWPFVIRPVWLYYESIDEAKTIVSGIVCFGSIMFWWTGLLYVGEVTYCGFRQGDRALCFISWLWIPQWLFWASSTIGGFIFYMLPSVPFMAIAVAYVLDDWLKTNAKLMTVLYITIVVAFFIIYYPFLTGEHVSSVYFGRAFPEWLANWR